MENYKQRLLVEFRDLVGRRTLLERHIAEQKETTKDEQEILQRQLNAMMSYEEILFVRISKLMGVD